MWPRTQAGSDGGLADDDAHSAVCPCFSTSPVPTAPTLEESRCSGCVDHALSSVSAPSATDQIRGRPDRHERSTRHLRTWRTAATSASRRPSVRSGAAFKLLDLRGLRLEPAKLQRLTPVVAVRRPRVRPVMRPSCAPSSARFAPAGHPRAETGGRPGRRRLGRALRRRMLPNVRADQAEEHREQRRLPRTVAPQAARGCSWGHTRADHGDGVRRAVPSGQPAGLQPGRVVYRPARCGTSALVIGWSSCSPTAVCGNFDSTSAGARTLASPG